MRRVIMLGLIVYLLVFTGLATRNGQVLALSLIFVVYISFSFLLSPQSPELKFNRRLSSERVGTNEPIVVQIDVTNLGSKLEVVFIFDQLPANLSVVEGSPSHLAYLPSGQTFSFSYTLQGQRGSYDLSPVKVTVGDPFGMVTQTKTVSVDGHFFVIPPILRLKQVVIRPRRTRVYSGMVPSRTAGTGLEFLGVREYQEGDPTRWINWQASARYHSKVFSNEFEQERVADVGIVLDGRIRTNLFAGDHSLFEYSTLATATLADVFLAQGNRVSMLLYGQALQWTLPGYGKIQRERILRAIAQAQPGSSQVFEGLDHIPTRLFPAHSQVVLVSLLTSEDLDMLLKLRARGYHLIIVSPDPVSFETSFLLDNPESKLAERVIRMERELMLKRLKRAGIQVVNWDVSKPFDRVAQSHLGRRLLWLPSVEANP